MVIANVDSRPPEHSPPDTDKSLAIPNKNRILLAVSLVTLVYFIAGRLALHLAIIHASASAVWPPAGIALAAVLLFGNRVSPGIFVGAYLVNVTAAGSMATSLGIALGNTLEAMIGAYLLRTFANGARAFERPQDIFKFAILAGMLSTTISPTVGVTSLALGGYAELEKYWSIWLTWWLGDAGGVLIVSPLLLLWTMQPSLKWNQQQALEVLGLLFCLGLASAIVFGGVLPQAAQKYPLQFLTVPILIWAAFRFGRRETATATFLFTGLAIWGTLQGFGPFSTGSENHTLVLLQAFLGVIAMMALALAAGVEERKRVDEALRTAYDQLEGRVEARTSELAQANVALEAEILERKRVEEAISRERAFSERIINSSVDGILAFDRECRYTLWNAGMEHISGLKQSEVLGRHAFEVFPFLKESGEDQYFLQALDGQTAIAYDRIFKVPQRGKTGFFEGYYSPVRDDMGRTIGGLAIIRDIGGRKEMEKALEESEAKFRSVIESAHDAVVMADSEGFIRYCNKPAERMFGYQSGVLVRKPLSVLMPERYRDAHEKGLERLRSGQEGIVLGKTLELDGLRQDGEEFPIELSISMWNTRGSPFYSGIIRDITERKQVQMALQEAHDELERHVAQRTAQLAKANEALHEKITDLETFHDVVIGRELRMMELEKELEQLKAGSEGFTRPPTDQPAA